MIVDILLLVTDFALFGRDQLSNVLHQKADQSVVVYSGVRNTMCCMCHGKQTRCTIMICSLGRNLV